MFVLVEAFNKILKKKSDQFKTYTIKKTGNGLPTNVSKGLDCNPASASSNTIAVWEHGDKISRYIRKVGVTHFFFFFCNKRKKYKFLNFYRLSESNEKGNNLIYVFYRFIQRLLCCDTD